MSSLVADCSYPASEDILLDLCCSSDVDRLVADFICSESNVEFDFLLSWNSMQGLTFNEIIDLSVVRVPLYAMLTCPCSRVNIPCVGLFVGSYLSLQYVTERTQKPRCRTLFVLTIFVCNGVTAGDTERTQKSRCMTFFPLAIFVCTDVTVCDTEMNHKPSWRMTLFLLLIHDTDRKQKPFWCMSLLILLIHDTGSHGTSAPFRSDAFRWFLHMNCNLIFCLTFRGHKTSRQASDHFCRNTLHIASDATTSWHRRRNLHSKEFSISIFGMSPWWKSTNRWIWKSRNRASNVIYSSHRHKFFFSDDFMVNPNGSFYETIERRRLKCHFLDAVVERFHFRRRSHGKPQRYNDHGTVRGKQHLPARRDSSRKDTD